MADIFLVYFEALCTNNIHLQYDIFFVRQICIIKFQYVCAVYLVNKNANSQ